MSNFQFQQAKNILENINRASENRTGQVKVLSPLARMATKKKSLGPDTVSASKTSFLPSFLPSCVTSSDRSRCCEFLSFSISLRNRLSLTGKPPSSLITDPGSAPTSSQNTRPNRSSVRRHRPSRTSWDTSWPVTLCCLENTNSLHLI